MTRHLLEIDDLHPDELRVVLDLARSPHPPQALEGQGGGPITIAGHPLCIAPGEPATVGRSTSFSYTDYGMTWNLSGRNGFMSPFRYASA